MLSDDFEATPSNESEEMVLDMRRLKDELLDDASARGAPLVECVKL